MTTTVRARPAVADRGRAWAVLLTAVVQFIIGSFFGAGALGDPVGVVAMDHTTPVMPAPAAFAIWGLIYAALLVLAVRQFLPGQRVRVVHRATGWWLTLAAVLNAGWIALFSQRLLGWAELAIVALLVVLAWVLARLSAHPAEGAGDRLALHGPLALYTGWVSVATAVGTASTGQWLGIDSTGAFGAVLGVVVLLAIGAIAGWVVVHGAGAVPYAGAVVWALGWIVAAPGAEVPVVLAALVAAVAVITLAARRVVRARDRVAAAFG